MRKLLVSAAAAMFLAASAQAAPVVGTGSIGALGITGVPGSGPGEQIGLGTVFTGSVLAWAGGTGDLAVIPVATPMSSTAITASVGTPLGFDIGIGGLFGSFAGTVTTASSSGPASNRVVDLFALGTFTPDGGLPGFDPGPMSLTFSATQTGALSSTSERAISISWTIASPPVQVPEPMSLALVAVGMLGAGLASRRKAANS